MSAARSDYRGTVALRHVIIEPPVDVTALALTCWDDSFTLHGIQQLPTPPPSEGKAWIGWFEATTDTGSRHNAGAAGGGGHPRFLWHARFSPALPPNTGSVTLSGTMADAAISAQIQLRQWPPATYDAPTNPITAAATAAPPPIEEVGPLLPDRVVALSADLGVIAGIRRAVTCLYWWPSWFLMTLEATGDQQSFLPTGVKALAARGILTDPWEMEDDRGNYYAGLWSRGWAGQDHGVHIAIAPAIDLRARELRLSFTDPFGRAGRLTTIVTVRSEQQSGAPWPGLRHEPSA